FIKEKFVFTEKLTSHGLNSEFFKLIGEDFPIITSLDSVPIELTILFRKGIGLYDSMSNSQFIMDKGEIPEDYFVMSSRHTDISSFTFQVSEDSSFLENLDVQVESQSRSGEELLEEAISALKNAVNSLEVKEHLV